jgi:hypothetical protein
MHTNFPPAFFVCFAAVLEKGGIYMMALERKLLNYMKLMYINKAVLKFKNSQPWQANQKKPNCARRMYAPGSSTKSQHCSWRQKKQATTC